jgi:acyl carrier protein
MNGKLAEIVADIFFLDETEVTMDLTPEDVGLWDSLNHLILITAVENAFNIKLTMSEIQSVDNIGKLNELVSRHTG